MFLIDYGIMNHSDCNDDFLKKCTGLYIFMCIFNYRFILTCRPFHATQLTDGFSHKILAGLIHPSHFTITRKSLAHFCTLNCKIYCWRNNQTDSCSHVHIFYLHQHDINTLHSVSIFVWRKVKYKLFSVTWTATAITTKRKNS